MAMDNNTLFQNLSDITTDALQQQNTVDNNSDTTEPIYNIETIEYPVNDTTDTTNNNPAQFTLTPEIKAEIVFNNFIKNSNRILSGKEKRSLHRECIRNAKLGRYDYMFDPDKLRKREERDKAKFDKLNAPAKHTVDDIPADVQKSLLGMVDKEPWSTN